MMKNIFKWSFYILQKNLKSSRKNIFMLFKRYSCAITSDIINAIVSILVFNYIFLFYSI